MDNTKPSPTCKQYNRYQWLDTEGNGYNTKRKDEGFSSLNASGYKRLSTGELLHRVMYQLFVGEIPPSMFINHINSDKLDNRIENLELVTPRQNSRHYARNVGHPTQTIARKLTDDDVINICNLLRDSKRSIASIAKEYGVSPEALYAINQGKNYSRITEGRFRDYPIRSKA